MKLRNILNENNYQDLYHFRSIAQLFEIIKTNKLGLYANHGVSLTRNKNFSKQSNIFKNMEVWVRWIKPLPC